MADHYVIQVPGTKEPSLAFQVNATTYGLARPGCTSSDLRAILKATLREQLEADFAARRATITRRDLGPGERHPRINRGENVLLTPDEMEAQSQAHVALSGLIEMLTDVFRCIEPAQANSESYGHAIRQVLLFSCMEFEASAAAVLRANGVVLDRPTTKDYCRLMEPMHLQRRGARLRGYPQWPLVEPFAAWSAAAPTQSLPWYDAYNRTKHDRETHLNVATLGHAISATTAAFLMLSAQFGRQDYAPTDRVFIPQLGRPFSAIEQYYYPVRDPNAWTLVHAPI